MLPGFAGNLLVGAAAKAPPRAVAAGALTPTTSSATRTLAGVNFGPEDPKRWLVFAMGFLNTSAPASASVTIGGVAAPQIYSPSSVVRIYSALVPTGSSGNINIAGSSAFSGAPSFVLLSLTGIQDGSPEVTNTSTGSGGSPIAVSSNYSTTTGRTSVGIIFVSSGNNSNVPTISSASPVGGLSDSNQMKAMYGVGFTSPGGPVSLSGTVNLSGGGSGSWRTAFLEFS